MKRVRLSLAGLKVEFCDRERAIRQVEELAERGTVAARSSSSALRDAARQPGLSRASRP
jgi:hypothetical protein